MINKKIDEKQTCVPVRIPLPLLDKIDRHCADNVIANRSEFIRNAITKVLTPDIKDENVKFESLKNLHDKQNIVEKDLNIMMNFLSFFVKYYMVYAQDIPDEMKSAASKNAVIKYDKFFKGFKDWLKDNPSFFENFLADTFEEKKD